LRPWRNGKGVILLRSREDYKVACYIFPAFLFTGYPPLSWYNLYKNKLARRQGKEVSPKAKRYNTGFYSPKVPVAKYLLPIININKKTLKNFI
jgi:hypothetical protein